MNENLDQTLDTSSQEERDFDRALRPKGFDEFFGQDSILKNLKVFKFDVDYWLSLGTPKELQLAEYWFDYFSTNVNN